ncbi:MAG: hypothetical protein L3J71_08485 [Victivallaceae bacterium]|nr:hypothetical protein [Victivallaceae bacterium]
MKPFKELSETEKIIYRISKISELTLKLSKIGYANGLHNHKPRAEKERDSLLHKSTIINLK